MTQASHPSWRSPAPEWSPASSDHPSRRPRGRRVAIVLAAAVVVATAAVVVTLVTARGGSSNNPTSIASAVVSDLQRADYGSVCPLVASGERSTCRSEASTFTERDVVYKDLRLGIVTVSGTRALAVFTGSVCATRCLSNTDPDVALDGGQSFAAVYARATGSTASSPFILPMAQDGGGTWFVTGI